MFGVRTVGAVWSVRAVRQFLKLLLFAIRGIRFEQQEQSNIEHLLFAV